MNPADLRERVKARLEIKESNNSIKQNQMIMKSTASNKTAAPLFTKDAEPIRQYHGFTDPEERQILSKGGTFKEVEAHRKTKAEAAAPGLLQQLQAGENPSMNRTERDAVLALSIKSAPSASRTATPPVAAPVPTSAAPVAAKPATEAPAPKPTATAPTSELTGLARATAAHQGKAITPAAPKELTGLAKATAIHKANPKASTTSAPSGKVDISGLTGLERATAAHKAASDARKK